MDETPRVLSQATNMRDHRSIAEHVSLRRADWRFLLPYPPGGAFQHLVLLGGPAGLAERLVDVGFARRVSCTLPQERSADAVVALHNAQVAFRDAARCLVAGGAFYCEIKRWSPSSLALTPHRIRRTLQAVGLSPTGIYWAIPNFVHCMSYIPLDTPEVLRWYFTTFFPAITLWHRLFELSVRTLTGFNHRRMAPLAPCYSVTARAGSARNAAPSVLGHPALPEELHQPDLRPLVLTRGMDDGSRVVILPFAPGSIQPIAVLKVSRLTEFAINTEREQETLTEVRSYLDAAMCRTIPHPLGIFHYGELTVGLESYAAGHSLLVSSGHWRAARALQIDDLRLAASWLCTFHQQTQISRLQWKDAELCQWLEGLLTTYTQAFEMTAREERLFAEVRKCMRALGATSIPLVWQHNDFGPWNIYRAGCELTVIDWEFGHTRDRNRFGLALCDLLYFVIHWHYIARHLHSEAAQLHGFRELFIERNGHDACAIHQVIAAYMTKLRIDPRCLPLLLVYTWVERALDHFNRQQLLGKIGIDARTGNRYIAYVDILASHMEWLFTRVALP